jgi:hypothetical protein
VSADVRCGADEAFGFLSDLRNELRWNPRARRVTKLTPGPVDVGTRFEAEWDGAPKTIVELSAYEPPLAWETRSRSLAMDVTFRGTLLPSGDVTRYTAAVSVNPRGLGWLLAPLAVRAMRRQEVANMRDIKDALESEAEIQPDP